MIASQQSSIDARTMTIAASDRPAKIAGILFAAIFSALAWVALIAAVSFAAGATISGPALAFSGTAIAMFLTFVCAPLMLRT